MLETAVEPQAKRTVFVRLGVWIAHLWQNTGHLHQEVGVFQQLLQVSQLRISRDLLVLCMGVDGLSF